MIFDSHCHLHDKKFDSDRQEIMERAVKAGVSHFMTVGCDISTTKSAQSVANTYENVCFSAGFHPHEAKFLNQETLASIHKLAQDKKCRAIGECGLDYYYAHSTADEQKKAFIDQINLAKELNLPLIVHLRDAFEDCKKIMNEHCGKEQKVIIHCFSGTLEQAKFFEQLGFFISLSGILTFKKPGELVDVAKEIALNQLLIETDCPYLAPHPFRGKRNEPAYIRNTLEVLKNIRDENAEKVEATIFENTKTLFDF